MSNRTSLEMLELIGAVRTVLTVAKQIQDRIPDATVEDIALAVGDAIILKRARLGSKGYSKLSAKQKENYRALQNAQHVIPQVQSILMQARERTPEEIAEFVEARQSALDTRKLKAAETKAKKAAEAAAKAGVDEDEDEQEDMFAEA